LVLRSSARANSESLSETFLYDNLHRVKKSTTVGLSTGSRVVDFDYDALGNIITKSDVSNSNGYQYGGNGGGVHAVSQITAGAQQTQYHYDTKGNMTQRGQQSISYSVFNKPLTVSSATASTQFKYGPNRNRFYQRAEKDGQITQTRYYDNAYEIAIRGQQVRERTMIGDFLVVSTIKNTNSPSVARDIDYLHRDHLGSIEAITDKNGNYLNRYSFDVWGKRQQDDWLATNASYDAAIEQRAFESTTRSFTGHEYLDSVELIHMNGRVYDPVIGRFLSPDDYVQLPENSQSYNRYSYVLNNPLSYTDPSGELIWFVAVAAVKAYDIYTTASDIHSTVTDDNLSTAEKSTELAIQLAMSVVPSKGIAKKVNKTLGSPNVKSVQAPKTDGVTISSKPSPKGTGSDKKTQTKKENKSDNSKQSDVEKKSENVNVTNKGWKGPCDYSCIADPKNLVNTKPTPRQVREMKRLNREHNDGLLRSDMDGTILVDSKKSMRGVTPPSNEAQIDHILSVDKGGTRTSTNLQILSRKQNRDKSNN
jgi:RHS repeat-associated protein